MPNPHYIMTAVNCPQDDKEEINKMSIFSNYEGDIYGQITAQDEICNEKQQEKQFLSYKIGSSLRRIELQQLFYLQADDKYVRMVFAGGEALTELSLKQLEDLYPEQLMIQADIVVSR